MSDDWTQQQLREIRRLAPDYGWQGKQKDGDTRILARFIAIGITFSSQNDLLVSH
jgi:hypothetical protein